MVRNRLVLAVLILIVMFIAVSLSGALLDIGEKILSPYILKYASAADPEYNGWTLSSAVNRRGFLYGFAEKANDNGDVIGIGLMYQKKIESFVTIMVICPSMLPEERLSPFRPLVGTKSSDEENYEVWQQHEQKTEQSLWTPYDSCHYWNMMPIDGGITKKIINAQELTIVYMLMLSDEGRATFDLEEMGIKDIFQILKDFHENGGRFNV